MQTKKNHYKVCLFCIHVVHGCFFLSSPRSICSTFWVSTNLLFCVFKAFVFVSWKRCDSLKYSTRFVSMWFGDVFYPSIPKFLYSMTILLKFWYSPGWKSTRCTDQFLGFCIIITQSQGICHFTLSKSSMEYPGWMIWLNIQTKWWHSHQNNAERKYLLYELSLFARWHLSRHIHRAKMSVLCSLRHTHTYFASFTERTLSYKRSYIVISCTF